MDADKPSRLIRISSGALLLSAVATFAVTALASDGEARWWGPDEGRTFPEVLDYDNEHGTLRTLLVDGPLDTTDHPFFTALGPNGRACVTCHQPADGMSLSVASVREQWEVTNGEDPLFAAYDGSNCPNLPQGERASHSLLLDHGLIRIERSWPPAEWQGEPVVPEISIEVVNDPTGCNSGAEYGPSSGNISVYRRPRPIGNMKYLLAVGFDINSKEGLALPRDPVTGEYVSGNIMADNRFSSLQDQMADAGATHLGLLRAMTSDEIDQIEDFEMRLYAAQQYGGGGAVDEGGATGGPATLRDSSPGELGAIGFPVWGEFAAWEEISEEDRARLTPEQVAFRESVARGARTFRERTFLVTDAAGLTTQMGFGNPFRVSCSMCHNMTRMGNDTAPGQVDLGTTSLPFADPMPHLPLFRVTCLNEPHPYYGRDILTHDPGFALSTGRCRDVGKITLQSMRGLASRAPYFSNGSASDLREVIDYYDRRYNIGYSEQEKQDLVNLMSVL